MRSKWQKLAAKSNSRLSRGIRPFPVGHRARWRASPLRVVRPKWFQDSTRLSHHKARMRPSLCGDANCEVSLMGYREPISSPRHLKLHSPESDEYVDIH